MKEIDYLKHLDTEGYAENDLAHSFEIESLQRKLVIKDGQTFEELKNVVMDLIDNESSLIQNKSDSEIAKAIGFVRLMGECTKSQFDYVMQEDSFVSETALFRLYIRESDENPGNESTYIYRDYESVINALRERRKERQIDKLHKLNDSVYISYFYNGYDNDKKDVCDFFIQFKSELMNEPNKDIVSDAVERSILLDTDRKIAKYILQSYGCISDDIKKSFDSIANQYPSGALMGYSPNDLNTKIIKNTYSNRNRGINGIQEDALLSPKDTRNFLKLYYSLINFVNEKYNLYPGLNFQSTNTALMIPLSEIIDKFWENKNVLIDEYCEQNPLHLSIPNLQVVKEFKYAIRNQFCVSEIMDGYTVFFDGNSLYMVKGLSDRIDRTISSNDLPLTIQTSLFPFHGDIVYGGIIEICTDDKDLEQKAKSSQSKPIYTLS